jgi:glucosyl-dolichyl phosphate glucuronosyltransferase
VQPRVGVVIPCHTEKRWEQLSAAVGSVLTQQPEPVSVVVVVDHNETLYELASRELTGATVLRNGYPERGVSGNRNTGAFHLDTPLIALLDDDAYAHPGWLAGLLAPFEDPDVCGTGGAISPAWETRRPGWVPDEFLWAWGGSYTGMPTTTARVRNVWSASMAVRREVFEKVGGFRVGFGKVGDRSRPEDTDLCLRMSEASGGHWMYVPDAVIDHPVPADKATFRYFVTRCYNEGRGKVEMARLNHGKDSLGSESAYLRRTLPAGVGRGLADTVRGRGFSNTAKAATIVLGMASAAWGGFVESVRGRKAAPVGSTPEPAHDEAAA